MFAGDPDFEVVGEAANGREAVDRTAVFLPDVVLMDLRMPELDGVSATKEIVDRALGARVLILTTYDTESDVLPAIEAGATGYLLKDTEPRLAASRSCRLRWLGSCWGGCGDPAGAPSAVESWRFS
jgi:DNA-binding NarL/FixJ family response regulator